MTQDELHKRVEQIDSSLATVADRQRIVDRFNHYKTCTDEELLTSCIIIQGMEGGAAALRATIKELQDQLLDAQNALTVFKKTTSDMREAQTGFFKAAQASREKQEFLRRSKMLEAQVDTLLKAKWMNQPDLFSK